MGIVSKESGRMTSETATVPKYGQTGTSTLEIGRTTQEKEGEYSNGLTGILIKDNGRTIRRLGMEFT